jgi:hypothetical protein
MRIDNKTHRSNAEREDLQDIPFKIFVHSDRPFFSAQTHRMSVFLWCMNSQIDCTPAALFASAGLQPMAVCAEGPQPGIKTRCSHLRIDRLNR